MRLCRPISILSLLAAGALPSGCALVRALGGDDAGEGDDDDDIGGFDAAADPDASEPDGGGVDAGTCAPQSDQLDLLIVVDRRPTGAFMEPLLAEAVGPLLDAIGDAGRTDLRVAVVSDEMEAPASWGCDGDAAFQTESIGKACQSSYGSVLEGAPGEIAGDLACLVTFPTTTCELPQFLSATLRAMERAAAADPANDHFRRAGTPLAILIFTDRDDCSIDAQAEFPGRADDTTQWQACFIEPNELRSVSEITGLLEHVDCPGDLRVQIVAGVPDGVEDLTCGFDAAYHAALLADRGMVVRPQKGAGVFPGCQTPDPMRLGLPPGRLVEAAATLVAAGARVGVQSICETPTDLACAAAILAGP